MVPLWALVVLHVVHDLAECGTIVEVNLYRFALLIVVDERFAMLADVWLGILRVRNVDEKLPNGDCVRSGFFDDGLTSYSSMSWWFQSLSPSIMDLGAPSLCWPPTLSPFRSSASLEIGELLEEFDIGARKQGTTIVDVGLRLRHCGKGKIECQTLVINITAINKPIKTRLWRYPGIRVLFKNRIKPNWIKPDTTSPGYKVHHQRWNNDITWRKSMTWQIRNLPMNKNSTILLFE